MKYPKLFWAGLLAGILFSKQQAFAQWVTQSIPLNPGWNAVYLQVQPAVIDCDAAFAGIPVESVWAWSRTYSSVQFIQDANQLVPAQVDWLTYLPSDHPARATRNLFALQGGRSYLIKLKNGAVPTTWQVVGQPIVRAPAWFSDSYNLVGFQVASINPPNFQSFFASSPALAGQTVYRLSSTGFWQPVTSPSTTLMRNGEAFWIYCTGASSFSGPLQLTLQQRDGLLYGNLLTEQTIRIKNNWGSVRNVTIQELSSQPPPNTNSFPAYAGSVPLSYFKVDVTNGFAGWVNLSGPLQRTMQPGEEWVVRLEVNRPQMAAPNPGGVLYENVLQVSDDSGVRMQLSVSSEGLNSGAAKGAWPTKSLSDARIGLWTGSASIDRVSQPANTSSPTNPLPVAAPLQFRLLVHVDTNGTALLLQKVLEMFKNGTLGPDPSNPTNNIVLEPGRYVLVTDDSLIPNFTGATLRDSQPVGRRLSSSVFGFRTPIPLTGDNAFGSGTFTCQINLDYDDPVNPFKHRYHPDHDNLDARYAGQLPEGLESFTVNRQIQLQFTDQDPDNLTTPGWGDDRIGGIYRETITGLHQQPIYVSGTFRLTRASTVGVLNDGH